MYAIIDTAIEIERLHAAIAGLQAAMREYRVWRYVEPRPRRNRARVIGINGRALTQVGQGIGAQR
jgi:hypothetical protein